MRILHLEASSGWGGQEMRILKEAIGMRERGHTLVFGIMRRGKLIEHARNAGFIVYELNFKKSAWLICLFQLLRILSQHKIDIVNTHSSLDSWIGGIAARIGKVKIVRTRHLSTSIKEGLNSYLLYGKLADFVVTTCSSILPFIAKQSKKSPALCRCVATGVDPEKMIFDPKEARAFREKIQVKEGDFLVGTACFMRSWKGIYDLLQAASILKNVPNLRFVIIGGGHAEIHHKQAAELHLEGIVHFTGHLDNPFAAIGALDAFTLLSTANEGVSQAILQAAYLEKPLIATPTGGLSEVCIDQKTGIQVPCRDPKSVAKAILELKNNPVLRNEFAKRARELVLEKFTFQQTLDQMEEILESVDKL